MRSKFKARLLKSGLIGLMVAALALAGAGCQSVGGTQGDGGGDPCNPAVGALAGAALGALIGGTTGNGGGRRAAIGAAVGAGAGAIACVAFNAYSKQTRSAQEVNQDYRQAHGGQAPAEPTVTAYTMSVNPAAGVQPGSTAEVTSNMTVVDGRTQPVGQIKEALTLSGPDGQMRHEKVVNPNGGGGGSYQNQFQIKLPAGLAEGSYRVRTQLYVNGQMQAEREQNLQVVMRDGALQLAWR
jgi:hypothetical protein